jgi:uncharacterized repeat protein (TIGR01451 family)
VVAGDVSHWYNLNCANGDSGTVQISVSGPVTYVSPGAGALTPIVAGNIFTYRITNYGTINNNTAFNLILKTDTNAKAGDTICVFVTVTPLIDNNPSNNIYNYCYTVINSHDPNSKEVYPVNVAPGYDGWFTYTIHFQNTGTAAANNILVTDTLDKNLDINTFQLINYSHQNNVFLTGNVLTVSFPQINLPDSAANLTGSMGFVQYRIKPKAGLPYGTIIKNTGYVYFDYNAPVVTDTTQNMFTVTTSIYNIKNITSCKVFPNPNNGFFTLQLSGVSGHPDSYRESVEIYNVLGEKVYSNYQIINPDSYQESNYQIDLSSQPGGVYFYRVVKENGGLVGSGKVVIEH